MYLAGNSNDEPIGATTSRPDIPFGSVGADAYAQRPMENESESMSAYLQRIFSQHNSPFEHVDGPYIDGTGQTSYSTYVRQPDGSIRYYLLTKGPNGGTLMTRYEGDRTTWLNYLPAIGAAALVGAGAAGLLPGAAATAAEAGAAGAGGLFSVDSAALAAAADGITLAPIDFSYAFGVGEGAAAGAAGAAASGGLFSVDPVTLAASADAIPLTPIDFSYAFGVPEGVAANAASQLASSLKTLSSAGEIASGLKTAAGAATAIKSLTSGGGGSGGGGSHPGTGYGFPTTTAPNGMQGGLGAGSIAAIGLGALALLMTLGGNK